MEQLGTKNAETRKKANTSYETVLRSLRATFQLNQSGLTDTNFRNRCKLNASIFLSADPGVIVVKAIKGNT